MYTPVWSLQAGGCWVCRIWKPHLSLLVLLLLLLYRTPPVSHLSCLHTCTAQRLFSNILFTPIFSALCRPCLPSSLLSVLLSGACSRRAAVGINWVKVVVEINNKQQTKTGRVRAAAERTARIEMLKQRWGRDLRQVCRDILYFPSCSDWNAQWTCLLTSHTELHRVMSSFSLRCNRVEAA